MTIATALVAERLLLQPGSMFQSLGQRAWHAYWCLPRDAKLQPPSYRGLELKYGLTNARLQKLITGQLKRPSYGELVKMASALHCEAAWLESGQGPIPHAQYQIPPFPEPKRKPSAALSGHAKAVFERDAKQLESGATPARARRTGKQR